MIRAPYTSSSATTTVAYKVIGVGVVCVVVLVVRILVAVAVVLAVVRVVLGGWWGEARVEVVVLIGRVQVSIPVIVVGTAQVVVLAVLRRALVMMMGRGRRGKGIRRVVVGEAGVQRLFTIVRRERVLIV